MIDDFDAVVRWLRAVWKWRVICPLSDAWDYTGTFVTSRPAP